MAQINWGGSSTQHPYLKETLINPFNLGECSGLCGLGFTTWGGSIRLNDLEDTQTDCGVNTKPLKGESVDMALVIWTSLIWDPPKLPVSVLVGR